MRETAVSCRRLAANPLLSPTEVRPSRPGLIVECLLNPGAFSFKGRVGLLLRVAERPPTERGWVSAVVRDPDARDGIRILRFRDDDPALITGDPRVFSHDGQTYLTTLSHLRLAWSDDGESFQVEPHPALEGEGPLESFGVEDCRVTAMEDRFLLTYTAVSADGHGVGLASTSDWKTFQRHGMILPSPNKDCALFPRRIGDRFFAIHRPSTAGIGGNNVWIAESPDLFHWGGHSCLARVRSSAWDSGRIGAGGPPLETDAGWLLVYHGATPQNRYCLGAMLLDAEDPRRVLARTDRPILEPQEPYETGGFFSNVVFSNGHVARVDELTLYYGAADQVICGARLSIAEILASLTR